MSEHEDPHDHAKWLAKGPQDQLYCARCNVRLEAVPVDEVAVIADLRNRLSEAEQQIQAHVEYATAVQESIAQANQGRDAANDRLDAMRDRATAAETKVGEMQVRMTAALARTTAAEARVRELEAEKGDIDIQRLLWQDRCIIAEQGTATVRQERDAAESRLAQAVAALEKGRIMALTPGLQTMIDWEVWLDTMVYPVLRADLTAAAAPACNGHGTGYLYDGQGQIVAEYCPTCRELRWRTAAPASNTGVKMARFQNDPGRPATQDEVIFSEGWTERVLGQNTAPASEEG